MKPVAFVLFASLLCAQEPDEMLRRSISLVNAARPAEAEQMLRTLLQVQPGQTFARTLLGFLLLQKSALAGAEASFRTVLNAEPGSGVARFGLGVALSRGGKPAEAAQEFEKALADSSIGVKARLHWIEALFTIGDTHRSLQEARAACERFPMAPEFQGLLAKLYQASSNPDEALKAYTRAIELEPGDSRFYGNVIEILRGRNDSVGVLHWAERGLEADRDNPVLREEKATALQNLGRADEAERERQEAARDRDAELIYARASRALAAGDRARAKQLLNQCVSTNPLLAKAWAELGGMLRQEHSYEEARRAYVMALEGDPESAAARLGLALTLRDQGKAAEALTTLQRALGRGIESPDLLAGLAAAYLELGRTEEAKAAMLGAIKSMPDDPDLLSYLQYIEQSDHSRWHALIEANVRAGNRPGAEQACHACLARFPADRTCREQLAYLQLEAGNFHAAAQQFKILLDSGPRSKSSLDGLAFSLLKTGDYARAAQLFQSSLKDYGPDGWVYENLGFAHRCRGNIDAAIANYRKARDMSPDDPARQHDLGFALYLARKYEAAAEPLQAAVRARPDWGLAHYDLAMDYWQLKRYEPALKHARIAQQHHVPQAARIIAALGHY